eukprot:930631-Amphidinium_carterae.1
MCDPSQHAPCSIAEQAGLPDATMVLAHAAQVVVEDLAHSPGLQYSNGKCTWHQRPRGRIGNTAHSYNSLYSILSRVTQPYGNCKKGKRAASIDMPWWCRLSSALQVLRNQLTYEHARHGLHDDTIWAAQLATARSALAQPLSVLLNAQCCYRRWNLSRRCTFHGGHAAQCTTPCASDSGCHEEACTHSCLQQRGATCNHGLISLTPSHQ